MRIDGHPVRRCSQCDRDWPNQQMYNLCPICLRCTWASTSTQLPSIHVAQQVASSHQKFREFCNERDMRNTMTIDEMELALAATPSIPDPPPNPQAVTFRHPPLHGGYPEPNGGLDGA